MGDSVDLHLQVGPVERAVQQLFQSMVDLDVAPTGVDQWGSLRPIIGIIHLSGGWDGFVLTGFEPSLAGFVASHMMAQPGVPVSEDELRDVVGEVANILAGNLKCLIPVWTEMSIPAVIEGTVSRKMELESSPLKRFYFTTVHGRFWLTLVPSGSEFTPEPDLDQPSDCSDRFQDQESPADLQAN